MSNPFETSAIVATRPTQGGALVEQESQRAVAEVQAAIILAKRFPRNQMEAYDRIITACQRPTLAESALYSYGRGGSDVTGPSIRLAEALAQNWGNIAFGVKELEQRNGESTVLTYCWDQETNTRQEKVFQVSHVRHTRQGQKRLEDPRDIYEMVANQGARRLRACILGIIPGDVVEAAVKECEKTMTAKADTSPDAIKKLIDAFAAFGVTREQIEKRIQRRLDAITPAQVVGMRKIYNSLKDGMSAPADWFEVGESQADNANKTGSSAAKEALKKSKAEKLPVSSNEPHASDNQSETQSRDLQQSVFKLLSQLAELRGETPDDTIDTLTNGKVGCQQDLMDKPDVYLNDIKMMIEAEMEKSKA